MAAHVPTLCPKCGQASTEADYCSECGAKIEGVGAGTASTPTAAALTPASAPPTSAAPAPAATGTDVCPACQTPRPSPDARFCEVCRYDFLKQTSGQPPVVAAPVPAPVPTPAQAPVAPLTPSAVKWDVVIAVDPSQDVEPDPDLKAPEEPERRIPLDQSENLIGRRNAAQNIVPDVRPHDPSVSRRHAKLLVAADGSVTIVDLESANGTYVNGEQILAGVPHTLDVGDVVTMGRWTRLRIEPRAT